MLTSSARIAIRFARLLKDLAPDQALVGRARARATAIASRLREAFQVVRFRLVGSHTKQTAIRSVSDIDVFVVLSRQSVRWGDSIISSNTLLDNVRDELKGREEGQAWDGKRREEGQA